MREARPRPSIPRELVDSFVPVSGGKSAQERAERLLREGNIECGSFPVVPYDDGRCWSAPRSRSHARWLHGFLFLADWHLTVLHEPGSWPSSGTSPDAVTTAADLFLRWQEVVDSAPEAPEMAFHDETTAQRFLQLVRLLDDHAAELDAGRRSRLAALAGRTAELLLQDDFYAGLNNHGMFQDLALLRYAAHTGWVSPGPYADEAARVAIRRVETYFRHSFTNDGVHVENSPAYHFMVARHLRDVLPLMLLLDPDGGRELETVYEGAARFATHSVYPDGSVAPLGDTKVFLVEKAGHRTTFSTPEFDHAVSRGARGRVPAERTAVFSEGGYAMHRTSWTDPRAYVVAFKAAYLSGYHHHADELAVTVFGQGRWLLSEAGPFGYEYQNPLTRYAYSQYAHNTVVIDGRSLPRVDPESGGVELVDLSTASPDVVMHVRGVNRRYDAQPHYVDASHSRELMVSEPDGSLQVAVKDRIQHEEAATHSYEILWHVGPGVRTQLRREGAELFVGEEKVLELEWDGGVQVAAAMVRPSEGPEPRAIRFPTFGQHEPGSVIRLAVRGAGLDLTTTIRGGGWRFDGEPAGTTAPDIRIERQTDGVLVTCSGLTPDHYVAVYLERDGTAVRKRVYERGTTEFTFSDLDRGDYRARVFVKGDPSQDADIYTTTAISI